MVTPDNARGALAEHLGPKGYAHSVAVAETAALLARTYDVDEPDAYLAGLLHDWARESSPESLLASARTQGLSVEAVDESVPYLLHARIAPHLLREVFPDLTDEVLRAVERHTLGAVDMSDLDRVVYVADQIEPARDGEGVDDLREAIGHVSLAELFESSYAASLQTLIRDRRRIHPTTVEAWNAIVDKDRA